VEAGSRISLNLLAGGFVQGIAQRGKPKSPQDPAAHDCIRVRFSSGTYLPWRFRVKRRDLEVHVEGRLVVNSVTVAPVPLSKALGSYKARPSSSQRILPKADL